MQQKYTMHKTSSYNNKIFCDDFPIKQCAL